MFILTKKIVRKVKKVNVKDIAKNEVMEIIENALTDAGLNFKSGVDYNMTNGTIIVSHEKADVQIKPISPKSGIERYKEIEIVYE